MKNLRLTAIFGLVIALQSCGKAPAPPAAPPLNAGDENPGKTELNSLAEIKLQGNQSVGDDYYSEISPEGIVREVSCEYSVPEIYREFVGMSGEFVFKFEAIAEGEAEIIIYNNFRGNETSRIAAYKAAVDKDKKLTLRKAKQQEETK